MHAIGGRVFSPLKFSYLYLQNANVDFFSPLLQSEKELHLRCLKLYGSGFCFCKLHSVWGETHKVEKNKTLVTRATEAHAHLQKHAAN